MHSYLDAVHTLGLSASDDEAVLAMFKRGISSAVLPKLLEIGITQEDLCHVMEHPEAGTLTQDDSMTLLRVTRVAVHARSRFTSMEAAAAWLHRPFASLGERSPIVSLRTEEEAGRVSNLLNQEAA